jgi:hypothetical protein
MLKIKYKPVSDLAGDGPSKKPEYEIITSSPRSTAIKRPPHLDEVSSISEHLPLLLEEDEYDTVYANSSEIYEYCEVEESNTEDENENSCSTTTESSRNIFFWETRSRIVEMEESYFDYHKEIQYLREEIEKLYSNCYIRSPLRFDLCNRLDELEHQNWDLISRLRTLYSAIDQVIAIL